MHKLYKEAIYDNRFLWAHILLGGLLCKLGLLFLLPQQAISLVLSVAILYELFQWLSGEHRNFLDAVGDIFGAFIMAIIVGL